MAVEMRVLSPEAVREITNMRREIERLKRRSPGHGRPKARPTTGTPSFGAIIVSSEPSAVGPNQWVYQIQEAAKIVSTQGPAVVTSGRTGTAYNAAEYDNTVVVFNRGQSTVSPADGGTITPIALPDGTYVEVLRRLTVVSTELGVDAWEFDSLIPAEIACADGGGSPG